MRFPIREDDGLGLFRGAAIAIVPSLILWALLALAILAACGDG